MISSKASGTSIHAYKDSTNVRTLRLALGAKRFGDLKAPEVYDGSSRVQTPQEGELIVVENEHGRFAAIEVVDVTDRTRPPDTVDSITIEYRINADGSPRFAD